MVCLLVGMLISSMNRSVVSLLTTTIILLSVALAFIFPGRSLFGA